MYRHRTDKSAEQVPPTIIAEATKNLRQAMSAEDIYRQEAVDDIYFRASRQWPDQVRIERERSGQPCLQFNLIPKFCRAVTGDARQNVPNINVIPASSDADKAVAAVFKGLIRFIEYESGANYIYAKGLDQAVTNGRGWWGIKTEYADEKSFDQDIRFYAIEDPLSVYVDPASTGPVYENAEWMLVRTWINRATYERDYPDGPEPEQTALDITDEDRRLWLTEDTVCVAWYYKKTKEKTKLYHIRWKMKGTDDYLEKVVLEDEYKDLVDEHGDNTYEVVKQRDVSIPGVMCYYITGTKVIEETEIPSKFIPLVPVLGEEIWLDGRPRLSGIVRDLKDPQRAYNYWMTMMTEQIALAPKVPWLVTAPMIEPYQNEWNSMNDRNFPYVRYKPDPNAPGQVPNRQMPPQLSQGYVQMLQIAQQGMNDTSGVYKPALGQESNETSGRAILARQREGDTGTYIYIDNWMKSIEHTGKICVDMAPRVYDTERVQLIINEQDEPELVTLGEKTDAVNKIYNLDQGRYNVRVTTGPSYMTKRQEAANSMLEFLRIYPAAVPVMGDLLAKMMDWEGADEIADRLKMLGERQGVLQPSQPQGGPPGMPPGAPTGLPGLPPGAPAGQPGMERAVDQMMLPQQPMLQ